MTTQELAQHAMRRRNGRGSTRPSGRGGRITGTLAVSQAAAWAGAAAIFMGISRVHMEVSVLEALSAPALASVLALLLLMGDASRWRPKDLTRHWIPRSVIIITVIAIVGVPFALYPGRAFAFLQGALLRTLMIGVIAWAISRTVDGARFLARVIALAGVTTALMAVARGRHDSSGRLSGAQTYDPNDLALIAVVSLPLVIWWISDRNSRIGKWLIPTVPILLWVVLETDSRSGFLGLAAVVAGMLVISFKWLPARAKNMARLFLVGLLLAVPFLPGDYIGRITSINDPNDYNRTSPTGRIETWKRGFGYALDYPLLGVGLDNFNTAEGWLSEESEERRSQGAGWKWGTAHNTYLQVTAELGFIAGITFIVLIVRTILTLTLWYRKRPTTGPPDLLPPFLGLTFVGYAVPGFFLSFAYYDIVYVLLGLASAVMLNAGPPIGGGRRRRAPARGAWARPAHPARQVGAGVFDGVRG